jgi:hypothetical protein
MPALNSGGAAVGIFTEQEVNKQASKSAEVERARQNRDGTGNTLLQSRDGASKDVIALLSL